MKVVDMLGFDLIWLILGGIYLFQLKKEKGMFYEKINSIAAKKKNYDKDKFKRMQYLQVLLVFGIIIGFRLFQLLRSYQA